MHSCLVPDVAARRLVCTGATETDVPDGLCGFVSTCQGVACGLISGSDSANGSRHQRQQQQEHVSATAASVLEVGWLIGVCLNLRLVCVRAVELY